MSISKGTKFGIYSATIIVLLIIITSTVYDRSGYKAIFDNDCNFACSVTDGVQDNLTNIVWNNGDPIVVRKITEIDLIEYQPGLIDGNIIWEEKSLLFVRYRLQINNAEDLFNITLRKGEKIKIIFGADI